MATDRLLPADRATPAPRTGHRIGLGRRTFLAIGSAGVAGMTALGLAPVARALAPAAGQPLVGRAPAPAWRLSLGYVLPPDDPSDGAARIIPAQALPASAIVWRAARVVVRGLVGVAGDPSRAPGLALHADLGANERHRFTAWRCRPGAMAAPTAPTGLTLPVSAANGLRLVVAVEGADTGPGGDAELPLRLLPGRAFRRNGLASGAYVLVVTPAGDPAPRFEHLRLVGPWGRPAEAAELRLEAVRGAAPDRALLLGVEGPLP